MKTPLRLLAALAASSLAQSAVGELFVVQVGTGAATLSNDSAAVTVQKFADTGGSPTGTIPMPVAAAGANHPFTLAGNATTDGHIALSINRQVLTLAGYAVAPGVDDVANASAEDVPRVAARIALNSGAVDTSTAFTGDATYGGDNVRSAVSIDGSAFWMTGSAEGVRYATLGADTSTRLNTTPPTNLRVANTFNDQLYVSSATGAFQGISAVGVGMPTTEDQNIAQLPGFPISGTHSAFDFWFRDGATVYLADDGAAASGGGIQKWTLAGGTWFLAYTLLNNGTTTTGVRGLTGTVDNGATVLYATTDQANGNDLITLTDTGAAAEATVLATAPDDTVFRGVEFVQAGPTTNNADFDNSGRVDGRDFLIWQRGFGALGQPDKTTGDATGDGAVNGLDFAEWKARFGGAPAAPAASPVPEPTGATLVGAALFGVGAVAGRVRRRAGQEVVAPY